MDKKQWTLFGLVEQENVKLSVVSELLDMPIQEIKDVMADIKKKHPKLFFIDSERRFLSNTRCGQERKRFNTNIVSYDALRSNDDNLDEQIRHKY